MDVIPVIDLKGGQVVHARQGQRDAYQPIATPLCAGSAPEEVVAGLLRLHPFRALYVADLDAIEGRGDHAYMLDRLAAAHPGLEMWVDRGIGDADAARAWLARGRGCLVIGSESQRDLATVRSLGGVARVLLSLDFRSQRFVGPPALLDEAALWPTRVIAMTLARVGAGAGPDLARLSDVLARAGSGRHVYAAGGVRDARDLSALRAAGAAGVLVATALHTGAITGADLAADQ